MANYGQFDDIEVTVDNFVATETVTLGQADTYKQFQNGYTKMVNQTRRFPSSVR